MMDAVSALYSLSLVWKLMSLFFYMMFNLDIADMATAILVLIWPRFGPRLNKLEYPLCTVNASVKATPGT